jgi:hypothetical protein
MTDNFYKSASAALAEHEARIKALLPTDSYVAPQTFELVNLRLLAEIALALRAIESAIDVASYQAANR